MPAVEMATRDVTSPSLAVFDIDGTLTNTSALDDECFVCAVEDVLGIARESVDWSDAPHMTDAGIADWLWTKHRRMAPLSSELNRFREIFIEALQDEIARDPNRCVAIPGAAGLFAELRGAGWSIALATGCWGHSARLKLEKAGLLDEDVPIACADDVVSRVDIIRLAVRRASRKYARRFGRVVSIGDALWDVAAARELQLPFVGRATGNHAAALRRAGAQTILSDFTDRRAVHSALENAAPPVDLH
jgi:phosphoglycolate phosphatase-like HAD superfamily hydrolase